MASLVFLVLLISATFISTILSLPLPLPLPLPFPPDHTLSINPTTSTSLHASYPILPPSSTTTIGTAREPLNFVPWGPIRIANPPPSTSTFWASISYTPIVSKAALHHKPRLYRFNSGPWDRAWEIWNNLSERLKLFQKRDLNLTLPPRHKGGLVKRGKREQILLAEEVQEQIAKHLRGTGWWQKVKDWFTKNVMRKKLNVTRDQYEDVKRKYGYGNKARGGGHDWESFNKRRKDGRLGSAFPNNRNGAAGGAAYGRRTKSRFQT